jgi:hypothetical protein
MAVTVRDFLDFRIFNTPLVTLTCFFNTTGVLIGFLAFLSLLLDGVVLHVLFIFILNVESFEESVEI